jgi:hypothetical protein
MDSEIDPLELVGSWAGYRVYKRKTYDENIELVSHTPTRYFDNTKNHGPQHRQPSILIFLP